MEYPMKLWNAPFESVKSGRKRVEMRLFDEKRAALAVGDTIVFTNADTGERLRCKITALRRYKIFEELYQNYNKVEIGYREEEQADPKDMLAYYPQEEIDRYGVVAIEIELKEE